MSVNIKKLSELAHVSVSTVSKAFSGSNDISEETREHVFAIAKEHGCFEKYFKSKYKRKVIAVICPEFYSKFYASFCEHLQNRLLDFNSVAIMSSTNFDINIQEQMIEFYTAYAKVDGLIIVSPKIDKNTYEKQPDLLISAGNRDFISITCNDDGIIDSVKSLKYLGHTRIGYIGENLTEGKRNKIVSELKRQNLEVYDEYFFKSEFRFKDAGADGIEYFSKLEKMPSAIICAYDQIALGAIDKLNSIGLSVPDDVSVIGMNNIDDCESANVKLSSISSLSEEMADKTLEILFERIEGKALGEPDIILPTKLCLRESVGKAKSI